MPKGGDIILVAFPFTDLTGEKRRPAIVIGASEVPCITLFITSRVQGGRLWHVPIAADETSGLVLPSIIRCDKIASFDMKVVQGQLGRASKETMQRDKLKLRKLLR